MHRRTLPPPAGSSVYELTEWGRELEPILLVLGKWGFQVPLPTTATTLSATSVLLYASGESPRGGVVEDVADSSRAWIRELFMRLAGDAGARDPDQHGRQLAMLYDGATVAATMDRNPNAAAMARAAAEVLLDAATAPAATARRSRSR